VPRLGQLRPPLGVSGLRIAAVEVHRPQVATARKSMWQFVRHTDDPRVSVLQRFAKALGISLRKPAVTIASRATRMRHNG
jgi:hypothetical protein